MMFWKKNVDYSKKKLQSWSRKGKHPELISVLSKGTPLSKIYAIQLLTPHNYMNVKNALFIALDDENKSVALEAAKALIAMGANPDEQKKIDEVREKYGVEDEPTDIEKELLKKNKKKKPFVLKRSPLEKIKTKE